MGAATGRGAPGGGPVAALPGAGDSRLVSTAVASPRTFAIADLIFTSFSSRFACGARDARCAAEGHGGPHRAARARL